MIDADAKAIIRTLRDALAESRGYVVDWTTADAADAEHKAQRKANAILERVDGAIVEADEVLS
jgi:hypothetical protein